MVRREKKKRQSIQPDRGLVNQSWPRLGSFSRLPLCSPSYRNPERNATAN